MKRKLLSVLLVLAMALTLLPTAAFAAGNVVKFNGTGYTAWDDFSSAATSAGLTAATGDDGTVTISLTGDVEMSDRLEILTTDKVVLDLAGHTLKLASNTTASMVLRVETGANVELKSTGGAGAVDAANAKAAGDKSYAVVVNSGTLTIADPNVTVKNEGNTTGVAYGIQVQTTSTDAKLDMSAGTITVGTDTSTESQGVTLLCAADNSKPIGNISEDAQVTAKGNKGTGVFIGIQGTAGSSRNAELNVSGGAVSGSTFGIGGNGTQSPSITSAITVSNGTITGGEGGSGIFHSYAGSVELTGGEISGPTGVFMKTGSLDIPTGSTAKVTGTGAKTAYDAQGDGMTPTGDAIVADSGNAAAGAAPEITIAGGTVESTNASPVGSYVKDESATGSEVTISGGEFKATATDAPIINTNLDTTDDTAVLPEISGGKFNKDPGEAFIEDGKEFNPDDGGVKVPEPDPLTVAFETPADPTKIGPKVTVSNAKENTTYTVQVRNGSNLPAVIFTMETGGGETTFDFYANGATVVDVWEGEVTFTDGNPGNPPHASSQNA